MVREPDVWMFRLSVATVGAVFVSIAAAQILMAAALLFWLVAGPRRIDWPGYTLPAFVFMAATLASWAMSPDMSVGAPPVRKFVLFAMGLLAANFITSESRVRTVVLVLVCVAAVAAGVGLVQFGFQYMVFQDTGSLVDDPMILARMTGFMGHWMTFSGEQMMVWCVFLSLAWSFRSRWYWILGSLIAAALLLSFTRSAWLGAGAGVLTVALYLPPRKLLKMLIPIGIIGLLASPWILHRISMSFLEGGFAPDSARLHMVDIGVRMVRDHPLFGVGPNRVGEELPIYYRGDNIESFYTGHLHNNFTQIAAERGLLALGALLWFFGRIGLDLGRMSRLKEPWARWPAVSGLSVLVSFIVMGLFEFNFGDSETFMLLLFLVSIPYGVRSEIGSPERFDAA